MIFVWEGSHFEKIGDRWICRDWAMKGPTGTMKDKEVPEPYASQIEKAFRRYLKGEPPKKSGAELTRKRRRIHQEFPLEEPKDKAFTTLEKIRKAVKKDATRRRKGGTIGGVSAF